jgi:hypothetical protein
MKSAWGKLESGKGHGSENQDEREVLDRIETPKESVERFGSTAIRLKFSSEQAYEFTDEDNEEQGFYHKPYLKVKHVRKGKHPGGKAQECGNKS